MKLSLTLAALVVAAFVATASAADPAPAPAPAAAAPTTQPSYPPELDTVNKRASYALGMAIGENVKTFPSKLDYEILIRAIRDGIAGKPLMTKEQVDATMMEFQRELLTAKKTEGEAYLAKNKGAEGVKTTASGLQYKVVEAGNGKQPGKTDWVTVHYTGMLIDGTVFDSSRGNAPAKFPLNHVIAGWTEGLQLMKEGGKFRFFIPSELAYKERGDMRANIPPNSVLVFDVELISVDPPPAGGGEQ